MNEQVVCDKIDDEDILVAIWNSNNDEVITMKRVKWINNLTAQNVSELEWAIRTFHYKFSVQGTAYKSL